jgi:poly(A) polymerase
MEEHPQARYIVKKLKKHGYIAYYAGGWVRDFLLQLPSDDIDIATNATPEIIQKLFKKTVPIGISFGIVLVIIDDRQYEVATFRSDIEYLDGRRPTKIEFSSAIEDAKRRDFTINGMFYDPIEEKVIDYVNGKNDLGKKIIKAIGNPHERIKEDRLRMIRAIRIATRFKFKIDEDLKDAIVKHANELFPAVAIERITQEFYKMKTFASFHQALLILHEQTLLSVIFPKLKTTSLKTLNTRLNAIDDFPKETPLIAYLNELFDKNTLNDAIALAKYLKLANYEVDFIKHLYFTRNLLKISLNSISRYKLAYFYAHNFSENCLLILASEMLLENRREFLKSHEDYKNSLLIHIERIKTNKPLISSKYLLNEGIKPGIKMGKLLKEAEEISINDNINETSPIVDRLKRSSHWK